MTSSVYVNGGVKTTRTILKIIFKFIIFQYDNFLKTFSTGQKMPSETKNTMEIQWYFYTCIFSKQITDKRIEEETGNFYWKQL